jgi:hypothetical protein
MGENPYISFHSPHNLKPPTQQDPYQQIPNPPPGLQMQHKSSNNTHLLSNQRIQSPQFKAPANDTQQIHHSNNVSYTQSSGSDEHLPFPKSGN